MRKLISFVSLGLLLSSGVVFAAGTNRNPIPEPAGTAVKMNDLRMGSTMDDPVRIIQLVRYSSADATSPSLVSGDSVVFDTNSADGISVRRTTTSADGAFAGIVITTIQSADPGSTTAFDDLGHKNWGWIVIHGYALANVGAGGTNTNSAGDRFITSSDPGKITTFGGGGVTGATGARLTASTGGFFMTAASATATSVPVYVEAT